MTARARAKIGGRDGGDGEGYGAAGVGSGVRGICLDSKSYT